MMSAADFRVALAQLDMPQRRFAELTGYRTETISRWAKGRTKIPQNVTFIISLLRDQARTETGDAA